MTLTRRFVIAPGTARHSRMPSADRYELDAEVARMTGLFERLGYEAVDGFTMDMTGAALKDSIRDFVTAGERTENDVVVFYYTGHGEIADEDFLFVPTTADPVSPQNEGIPARELARWLLADSKVGNLLVILDTCHAGHGASQVAADALRALGKKSATGSAGVFLVTATGAKEQAAAGAFTQAFERAVDDLDSTAFDRPYLDIADVVERIGNYTPEWQHARYYVIGGQRSAPFLPTTHAARKTFREVLDRIEKKQDALFSSHDELFALVSAMSAKGTGPLSEDDHATLLRVVAELPEPDERTVAALYHQSVERATGMSPPAPLGEIRDYAGLIDELAEYLPSSPNSVHPLLACCALLVEWFPHATGVEQLKSLVDKNITGHIEKRTDPNIDASAIVLLEPGHPADHFLLTVWCYHGSNDVGLAYRGPRPVGLEQLREELRGALADALDLMALRSFHSSDAAAPALVEFILPVELLGEPVEDWPIGTDEPAVERIGWHHPVVLRDLGRFRQPRLHQRWRLGWRQLMSQQVPPFHWFDCRATPDRDPAVQFFAPGPHGPVAFTGSPLTGYRRELLGAGLTAGIPAILWRGEDCRRDDSGCDCDRFVEFIDSAVAGTPLSSLPTTVHVLRMTAASAEPGRFHRLALIWDDPFRWPEPPTRFVDPTRRGAK